MLPPLSMVIVGKKSLPNAQAKLRGLMTSRRAAVSSSLWLGSANQMFSSLMPFPALKLFRADSIRLRNRGSFSNR